MVISQEYHTPSPKQPQKQKEQIAQTPHTWLERKNK